MAMPRPTRRTARRRAVAVLVALGALATVAGTGPTPLAGAAPAGTPVDETVQAGTPVDETVQAALELPPFTSPPATGSFHPVEPRRILDTRTGLGGLSEAVGPGGTVSVAVTGQAGVPSEHVSAVVLNVTATDPTEAGYLTVFPSDVDRPGTSNVNFTPGASVPNQVTVKVGADGYVNVYNSNGRTHVIFDVAGWVDDYFVLDRTAMEAGQSFVPLDNPERVFDTRVGTGGPAGPLGPDTERDIPVGGRANVPADAAGVVVNVTVVDPTASGYVSVFPWGSARPLVSNLNFTPGQTVANLATVKLGPGGTLRAYNANGATHLLVDVIGYFKASDGTGQLFSLAPSRILDTRSGLGGARLGEGATLGLAVLGAGGLPTTGLGAVVLNVTVTEPTAAGFLTVFPSDAGRPLASNLNFTPGASIPNLVTARVSADGRVSFFNSAGDSHVIADVVGWYSSGDLNIRSASAGPGDDASAVGRSGADDVMVPTSGREADEVFTPAVMAAAEPADLRVAGTTAAPDQVGAAAGLDLPVLSAGWLPDRYTDLGSPYLGARIGRVFSSDGQITKSCSGTLVAPGVVVTAGHCLIDTRAGRGRAYLNDFAWVPAVRGNTAAGIYAASFSYATTAFRNDDFGPEDFGFLLFTRTLNDGEIPGDRTQPITLDLEPVDGLLLAAGYPEAGPVFRRFCTTDLDDGLDGLSESLSSVFCYPYHCFAPTGGYRREEDPELAGRYAYEVAFGCHTPNALAAGPAGGISGGPILKRFGASWRLAGVVSSGVFVTDAAGNGLYATDLLGPVVDGWFLNRFEYVKDFLAERGEPQ